MKILIMMIGAPGSGKTTLARKLASSRIFAETNIIVSSDEIRGRLFGDEGCQKDNDLVFNVLRADVKKAFDTFDDVAVIIDACNTNKHDMSELLYEFHPRYDRSIAIFHDGPESECIERNSKRDRVVPDDVIHRMYVKQPWPHEIVYNFDALIPFSVAQVMRGL